MTLQDRAARPVRPLLDLTTGAGTAAPVLHVPATVRRLAVAGVHPVGAVGRDRAADERDRRSTGSDRAADARDALADARDAAVRAGGVGRVDAAAAMDRAAARRDRMTSAGDRDRAHADRASASRDRSDSARAQADSLVDELTGAYRRGPGELELAREMSRAVRTGSPFVLAFVDVDGLKAVNDQHGHAAGDALLRHVVTSLRRAVRAYDLVVRYGGDEFLCGLTGLEVGEAAARLHAVNAGLRRVCGTGVSVGLARLAPGEDLAALVARADAAMYAAREQR